MSTQQLTVPLSHLHASKHNPRKVKPARDAHRRLVALIRAHGLIHPLVVRPVEGKPKHYQVVAGDRRLAALKEIHRNDGDPRIPCVLRKVDQATADTLSLGENFAREPMHPLDEAEAFAKLATRDGKDAEAIGAEFGVGANYVRQRIKLSMLADSIKAAYRQNVIDTATAEAFCAVPEDRQLQVWKEVNGHPHHAQHVRNIIASSWIDATHALFDVSTLPASAVSQDLFAERVLVERSAFMDAQAQAVAKERTALIEDGWSDVVMGRREDVHDRLLSMEILPKQFDDATTKQLAKNDRERRSLEKAVRKIDDDDQANLEQLDARYEALDAELRKLEASAPVAFKEATKARGTVFLILDPEGQVHREYRVLRQKARTSGAGSRTHTNANGSDDAGDGADGAPTSEQLSDRQLAITFTHQALCVREALLSNALPRKRVLALALHEKVRSEALAIRHDANGTTLHATTGDDFKSGTRDRLVALRSKLDPFVKQHVLDDVPAYEAIAQLTEKQVDKLIELLTVELVTAHLARPTDLIVRLALSLIHI